MVKGITNSGFEFEVDESVIDDIELLEDLRDVKADPTRLVTICDKLLGTAQRKALYEHLRDPETKRVKASQVDHEVGEIFVQIGTAGKNS